MSEKESPHAMMSAPRPQDIFALGAFLHELRSFSAPISLAALRPFQIGIFPTCAESVSVLPPEHAAGAL
jgi:hypothetical protein